MSSELDNVAIDWERFAKFVRQLSHDLRNQLNAAELQAALVSELVDDAEVKTEVKRLRSLVSQLGATLQQLSTAVAPPKPTTITYPVADLLEDLQAKMSGESIQWRVDVADQAIDVDPQLIERVLLELIENSGRHAPAPSDKHIDARAVDGDLVITLREPKAEPVDGTDAWGAEPLRSVSHGHYGLGLRRARAIIEAHRGQLRAVYDAKSSALVTTICLPLQAGR